MLVDILKNAIDNARDYSNEEEGLFDHIYAFHLLGIFSEESAHKTIIDIVSLPSDTVESMFGDIVTDDLAIVLCRTYDDLSKIKALIEDKDAYIYVRNQAVDALAYLMAEGELSRDELMEYYKSLLVNLPEDKENAQLLGTVICTICDTYPEELEDEIKKAFEAGRVDECYIGFNSVERTLKENKQDLLSSFSDKICDCHLWYDDLHALKSLPCFNAKNATINTSTLERMENEIARLAAERASENERVKAVRKKTKSKKKQAKKSKKSNRKKKK